MIQTIKFEYEPGEHEAEKASNSYLMSVIALIAGLPLPIINLIATLVFYVSNKKGTYFVRWHCTQALFSQFSLLIMNSFAFWWTISIIFTSQTISNNYLAYVLTVIIYNIIEFIATVYTAIQTRKGIHVVWWFYGGLTNLICKPAP
jgi:cell shape-determining protein MreD